MVVPTLDRGSIYEYTLAMHSVLAVKEGSLTVPIAQTLVFAHIAKMLGSDVFSVII